MDQPVSVFHFKEFDLLQNEEVWKVGTDSVLLGSWCDAHELSTVLDVGTGTGILSLMLAQRYPAIRIDAIDILPEAIDLAVQNVQASPWSDRIHVMRTAIADLRGGRNTKAYDLIISNAPYFPAGLISSQEGRRHARQGTGLSIYNIAEFADSLLTSDGKLAIVVPFAETPEVIRNANVSNLYVKRKMDIRNTPSAEHALSLMEFTRNLVHVNTEELTLRQHGQPTVAYRRLCEAFYRNPAFASERS